MIDETLFKKHFVGRDGFQWWVGQIPPEESWRENKSGTVDENNQAQKGFGERYRVRIMGYHTANADDIPDDELPWAYVMYPVTAGGGGRGSSQSANLTQGTFVFGWFMDGDDAQLPIIMGVLGHNDYAAVMKNVTPTRFLPFDGYPAEDPSFGSERSSLQVRKNGGDEILSQENAQGEVTNEQYTSSATGNTTIKTVSKPKPKPPAPLTTPCDQSPLSNISVELKNALNEIENINQMIYDARGAITAGLADAQRYIENIMKSVSSKIAGVMKTIVAEIQKKAMLIANLPFKAAGNLIPPDLRENIRLAATVVLDKIACVITAVSGLLPDQISGFLGDLFGFMSGDFGGPVPTKAVNIPGCFVEDFVSVVLGNIVGEITNAIDSAFDSISGIVEGVGGIVGGISDFINEIIAVLNCLKQPKCAKVKEWSPTSGASNGGSFNIDSILSNAESIAGSFTELGSIGDGIDFSDVFDGAGCDLGPRDCGPPSVQYIGDGQGAKMNLIISAAGEIMGADIISSGFGFSAGNSFLNVFDDCGIGQGGIIEPVFGDVVPFSGFDIGGGDLPDDIIVRPEYVYGPAPDDYNTGFIGNFTGDITAGSNTIKNIKPESILQRLMPGATISLTGGGLSVKLIGTAKITAFGSIILDRTFAGTGEALGASLSASGTVTQTGIVDIIVKEPGYGYLPSPNGASGGDGSTWKDPDETIIIGDGSFVPSKGGLVDIGDGFGTDYYPPIPPGNTVPIPPGATVTTPPNSNMTEGSDNDGNLIEILPGVSTYFPSGGSMTSPSIRKDIEVTDKYPSTTSYPVIIYLCELIVNKSGMDYQPTDEVVIEPNMGATAVPKFDKFGRLLSIKVTAGGEGFQEIPKCYIKSNSGFGSKITPKFCIDRLGEDDLDREPSLQDKIVSVIDCVGTI